MLPLLAAATTLLLMGALEPLALLLGAALAVVGVLVHLVLRRTTSPVDEPVLRPQHRSQVTLDEAAQVLDLLGLDVAAEPWSLEDLRTGMEVELEHGRADPDTDVTGDDLLRTAKIALVHLNEIPDYYPRLAAMEAEGRAAWRRSPTG